MKHSLVRSVLGGISAVALSAISQAQIKLNEIYASHSNTDLQEMIELKGPGGASLDNYLVCIVEGSGSLSNQGRLDSAWDLSGLSIPSDGYFVLGVAAVPNRDFQIFGPGATDANAIENDTQTFYLIDAGSNANVLAIQALIGTDVDSDNDGITTLPTLGTIVDSVGMAGPGTIAMPPTETIFDGATAVGPDANFFPAGIFRGLDAPNPWCPEFLDFNEAANLLQPRTPGVVNSVCPSAATITNYCTAGTTTNNCNATMSSIGTPSVSASSGFSVGATSVEGQKQGLIFYSVAGQNSLAWGTGSSFLCIKSPTQRTPAVNSGGTTNLCDGAISVDFLAFLAATPSAIGGAANGPLSAGNQVQFQCWFRDPPASKSTSLSDGLEVTMVP